MMSELLTYLQTNEPQFRKARLAALYSDFRSLLSTNPDGYNANLLAWRKALSSASLAGKLPNSDHLSIPFNENLYHALETKEWGRPLALGTVARDAVSRKEWWLEGEFTQNEESVYVKRWINFKVPGVGEVMGWGLKQLGWVGDDKFVGRVVVLSNLEAAGNELLKRFDGVRGRIERVFSRTAFMEQFADILGPENRLTEYDMELLLRFLERDKGVLNYDLETVKLKAPNDKSRPEITEQDTTIANLKTLIKDLNAQTEVLTKRVDELITTAKIAVEKKNRVAALAALRSKKLVETTLTKRHATLVQLEEVFASIEQAADQVEVVNIMEASSKALSAFNKEVGGVERVDDVVDQLREQMGEVDEIGNVIAEVGKADAVDEGEVDDELEAMEREERKKEEAEARKAKEEREKMEAEETRKKLDALEASERQTREAAKHAQDEINIDSSAEGLKRLSLEPAT